MCSMFWEIHLRHFRVFLVLKWRFAICVEVKRDIAMGLEMSRVCEFWMVVASVTKIYQVAI